MAESEAIEHLDTMHAYLWPAGDEERDWDSDDVEWVGEYLESGEQLEGDGRAVRVWNSLVSMESRLDEWDVDFLQLVAEALDGRSYRRDKKPKDGGAEENPGLKKSLMR